MGVICYASDIIGYGSRISELFNVSLHMNKMPTVLRKRPLNINLRLKLTSSPLMLSDTDIGTDANADADGDCEEDDEAECVPLSPLSALKIGPSPRSMLPK